MDFFSWLILIELFYYCRSILSLSSYTVKSPLKSWHSCGNFPSVIPVSGPTQTLPLIVNCLPFDLSTLDYKNETRPWTSLTEVLHPIPELRSSGTSIDLVCQEFKTRTRRVCVMTSSFVFSKDFLMQLQNPEFNKNFY